MEKKALLGEILTQDYHPGYFSCPCYRKIEGCCSIVCWHFQRAIAQGLVTTSELFVWEQEAAQRPFGILELSKM